MLLIYELSCIKCYYLHELSILYGISMHKPCYIELFAGCGGLSLGLNEAGWQGLFAIEKSKDAFSTLQANLIDNNKTEYKWPSWLPKEAMEVETLLTNYSDDLIKMKDKVDLLAGGPPCQGFSPAGRRNPDDPRNKLAQQYIEVVRLIQPNYLLLENVRGFDIPFKSKEDNTEIRYSEIVKERLEAEGYKVFFDIVRSSDWGVPQLRPRFILIAIKNKIDITTHPFEKFKTLRNNFLKSKGLRTRSPITVKEAIGDLEVSGKKLIPNNETHLKDYTQIEYQNTAKPNRYLRLVRKRCRGKSPTDIRLPKHNESTRLKFSQILNDCPKGELVSKKYKEKLGTKKQSIRPLHPDKPSCTITTLPDDILHYSEPRILTVREMARLQSFPDHFIFKGPYTTGGNMRKHSCPRYTQVGNAVPPLLGEALGTLLANIHNQN